MKFNHFLNQYPNADASITEAKRIEYEEGTPMLSDESIVSAVIYAHVLTVSISCLQLLYTRLDVPIPLITTG